MHQNPFETPKTQPVFDKRRLYEQSFLAVIWPSVAFSVLIIVVILAIELLLPTEPDGRSIAYRSAEWTMWVPGLMLSVVAHFFAARRVTRKDGARRTIPRSILVAVACTTLWLIAFLCATFPAALVRRMSEEVTHGMIFGTNVLITAPVYALLVGVVVKWSFREIHFRRLCLVNLVGTVLILLVILWSPSTPERTSRVILTFITSVFSLVAHSNCFAWWYATPRLEPERWQQ